MLAIPDHEAEVEAQARTMLRETLQRSRWYPQHWREDWDRLIERDVELMRRHGSGWRGTGRDGCVTWALDWNPRGVSALEATQSDR